MRDYYGICDIPALIKDVQHHLNINRNQLAVKTGISASVLYRIEIGQTVPTLSTLQKVVDSAGYEMNMSVNYNKGKEDT